MGYVWCDGYVWDMCGVRYVWDMCGVRYANNLLKNPATKRLSGKKKTRFGSNFFRPLGMQHFYDSFALVSQICVRREALSLFGLREDELLPDLHITREGVVAHRAWRASRTSGQP